MRKIIDAAFVMVFSGLTSYGMHAHNTFAFWFGAVSLGLSALTAIMHFNMDNLKSETEVLEQMGRAIGANDTEELDRLVRRAPVIWRKVWR